jgi:hypothetical protein
VGTRSVNRQRRLECTVTELPEPNAWAQEA